MFNVIIIRNERIKREEGRQDEENRVYRGWHNGKIDGAQSDESRI